VLAVSDKTIPTLIACIDQSLRLFGGVPTYALSEYVPRNIFTVLCPDALCGPGPVLPDQILVSELARSAAAT